MPELPDDPRPLRLGLRAYAPQVPVGGNALFELSHEVFGDLRMETVELNSGRTEILVERLHPTPASAVLTVSDHVAVQRVPPFTRIGLEADVPGGSRWTVPLSLLTYHRPFPVGRYRVALRYRYGDTPEAAVASDPAEFEVVPTAPVLASRRWSGGGRTPRRLLESLWVTPLIWMYQVARGDDPSAVATVTNLGLKLPPPETPPLIAHLDELPEARLERWVVWIADGALHWTCVSYLSRRSDVFSAPLPDGGFRLVDPPVQRQTGGCAAALVGAKDGGSVLLMAELGETGESAFRTMPTRIAQTMKHLGALWPPGGEVAGVVVGAQPGGLGLHALELGTGREYGRDLDGALVGLAFDQAGGEGAIFALVEKDEHHVLQRFDRGLGAPRTLCAYALAGAPGGLSVEALEPLASLEGAAVLYRHADGWVVRSGDQSFAVPPIDPGPFGVWLTAGPRRLTMTAYSQDRGFIALGLGHELAGNRL